MKTVKKYKKNHKKVKKNNLLKVKKKDAPNTITNQKRIMYDVHKRFFDINMKGKKIFFIWANENWTDNISFGKNNHKIINIYNDIEEHCKELIKDFKNFNYLNKCNKNKYSFVCGSQSLLSLFIPSFNQI